MKQIIFICIVLSAGVGSSCQKAEPVEPAVEIVGDNTLTRSLENNYVIYGPTSISENDWVKYTVPGLPGNYDVQWNITDQEMIFPQEPHSVEFRAARMGTVFVLEAKVYLNRYYQGSASLTIYIQGGTTPPGSGGGGGGKPLFPPIEDPIVIEP